ncbi:MAG: polyisoprenoid-binding protein [Deltaproteobacteria bacterium]|nr:MAG: polyisoprenoid-binding protein [Deltaproteobacteria bacterium]TNF31130.1 MAG: polyisoprenoid-binding protein [Deltaproteobacteria bacterium]
MKQFLKLFILFFIFVPGLRAETWKVNDDHSDLSFTVNYLKVSEVRGRFNELDGKVEFSGSDPKSVEVEIKTKSIDTGNKLRDSHLRRADFLDVRKHPKIKFFSKTINKLNDNVYEVKGKISIQNKTKDLTLIVTMSEIVKDTWGKQHRFAVYTGELNRLDFGLDWNKTLPGSDMLVGDRIMLKGSVQLQPYGGTTSSSKHMIADNKSLRNRERQQRGEAKKEQPTSIRIYGAAKTKVKQTPSADPTPFLRPVDKNAVSETGMEFDWSKWLAMLYHGLFGFIGCLTVFVGVKKGFLQYAKGRYDETNVIGYLSDVIGMALCLMWAISFYHFIRI